MLLVVVTYGTIPNQIYAEARTVEDAKRLQATAKSLGYKDARIENARSFYEERAEKRGGSAHPPIADRPPRDRRVHDLRSQSRASLAG